MTPNEPTLTCSEVVERLRQYEDLFDTIAEAWKNLPFAGVGNTLTCSADRSDIAAIDSAVEEQQKLRSTEWRERRVQELEEALREAAEEIADARYRSGREGYEAAGLYRGEPERDKLVDSIVAERREQIRKGAKHE